jgi:hypothetical protein
LIKQLFTQPRYMTFLFNKAETNRIFAITLFRLLLAYQTRSMRYCLLVFKREDVQRSAYGAMPKVLHRGFERAMDKDGLKWWGAK